MKKVLLFMGMLSLAVNAYGMTADKLRTYHARVVSGAMQPAVFEREAAKLKSGLKYDPNWANVEAQLSGRAPTSTTTTTTTTRPQQVPEPQAVVGAGAQKKVAAQQAAGGQVSLQAAWAQAKQAAKDVYAAAMAKEQAEGTEPDMQLAIGDNLIRPLQGK
jgi:hypothetical protein